MIVMLTHDHLFFSRTEYAAKYSSEDIHLMRNAEALTLVAKVTD